MKLSALLAGLEYTLTGPDVDLSDFQYDSRRIQPGEGFICLVGTATDGHRYIRQAEQAGAAALIVEHPVESHLPQAVVAETRKAMSVMAEHYYGDPADGISMIGVTGTNGKTTTTYMIKAILTRENQKTGLIGTVAHLAGEENLGASMTTPEPKELQGLFRRMADRRCENIVMEVSSHALSQGRVYGVEFDVAVFSNLTQDHLDYHGDMETYASEKKKLFRQCRHAVINRDDPYGAYMAKGLDVPVTYYGIGEPCDVYATDVITHADGVEYTLHVGEKTRHIRVGIPGRFTVYNSLAAIGACLCHGLGLDEVAEGASAIQGVPGRAEVVPTPGTGYTVLLDYSHTPDSLKNILETAREFTRGRIITVFGCGGDRDPQKRPMMGRVAGELSDYCVVTSDNPRTEDPMAIIRAILPGVEETGCPHAVVENRREAIRHAMICAKQDDVILLAGKGHEPYQEIGHVRHPFDEKIVVAELLAELRS